MPLLPSFVERREDSVKIPVSSPITPGPVREHEPSRAPLLSPAGDAVSRLVRYLDQLFPLAERTPHGSFPTRGAVHKGTCLGVAQTVADIDVEAHRQTAHRPQSHLPRNCPGADHPAVY